jgi:hypothetical protein
MYISSTRNSSSLYFSITNNPDLKSKTRDLLTLGYFNNYAGKLFPDHYAVLSQEDQWVIEHKTVRDGVRATSRIPMLLVGRAHYREGFQAAWAYATGLGVEYYYGDRYDEFVMSMKALYNNKVYFCEPLTYIAGSQDSRMNKSRRTGKALAELVIGIIFLQSRQLAHLQPSGETDVLEDFKYACLNFQANRDYQEDQKRIKTEAYEANEQVHAEFRGHQYRMPQAGENNI